jgi:hypothetical protein
VEVARPRAARGRERGIYLVPDRSISGTEYQQRRLDWRHRRTRRRNGDDLQTAVRANHLANLRRARRTRPRWDLVHIQGLYKGVPLIAVGLTFGVALAMLVLYSTRIIKVTNRLRSIIFGATLGIMFFYLITMALGFFGIQMPVVFNMGWPGLLFSSAVVIVAAMNLLLNFDMIERNAGSAPHYMEWYAAFGMLVTLVWLYLELLRWASIVFGGRRQ